MAELLSVSIITKKRGEIEANIAALEKRLEQARTDLLHVNATLSLFEVDHVTEPRVYMNLTKLFRWGEVGGLAGAYLAMQPDRTADIRQIALYIMQEKGWDASDRPLRTSLTNRITHALIAAERYGKFKRVGRRHRVNLWRATEAARLPA